MTQVDPYQQCPCGSGKKLKFCCGAELAHDLDAIGRAVSGQQNVVALDLVQRAIAAKGPKPALLVTQIQIANFTKRFDLSEAAVRELLKQRPKDPSAVGLKSSVAALKGDVRAAVEALQDALEMIPEGGAIPEEVAHAFRQLGLAMCGRGAFASGIAHLLAASQAFGHQDSELVGLLQRLGAARDVPLADKDIPPLAVAPEGVAWKADFDAAVKATQGALWRKARNQFRLLAENLSQEPAVLKNLAITQAMLGDPKATASTWRLYARLPGLPLDDAVEAEMYAQSADPGEPAVVESLEIKYPIRDVEACMELLLSDRRCFHTPVDPAGWDPDMGPPPKAAFLMLDRPMPPHGDSLAASDAPRVLGELFVYGKQTDRPALLEVEIDRDEDYARRLAMVQEIAGRQLEPALSEEVTGSTPAAMAALGINAVFPRDTPAARQMELASTLREETLTTRWIKVPLWECGGKSAVEAAADPKQRLPLLAAILRVELAIQQQTPGDSDANCVRKTLGLPLLEAFEATPDQLRRLPLARLARIKLEGLADQDVARVLQQAVTRGFLLAQRRAAQEAVRREAKESVDLALSGCEVLASMARDYEDAFQWIEKGRDLAARHGASGARVKILELEIRFLRGEIDTFKTLLMDLLKNEVPKDPNSGMLLYATMNRLGLVTEDGKFVVPAPRAARRSPLEAEPGAPTAGGIWTPGSSAAPSAAAIPPAPAPAAKSKLWIPGMD